MRTPMAKMKETYKRLYLADKGLDDLLRFLKRLNYVMGIKPFNYPPGRPRLSLMINFVYVCVLLINFNLSLVCQQKFFNSVPVLKIQKVLANLLYYMDIVVTVVLLIIGLLRNQSLENLWRRIEQVNKTLVALGSSPPHRRIYFQIVGKFILAYVALFIHVSLNFYWLRLIRIEFFISVYFSVNSIYPLVLAVLNFINYMAIVSCIKSQLKCINELLENGASYESQRNMNVPSFDRKSDFFVRVKYPNEFYSIAAIARSQRFRLQNGIGGTTFTTIHFLRIIRQIHLQLYEISKELGNVLGLQVAISISLFILYNIEYLCDSYSIYGSEKFYGMSADVSYITIYMSCSFCLLNTIQFFTFNAVCENAVRESCISAELIHSRYGTSTDEEIREEVHQFGLQMTWCRFTYSAFGFFVLNSKLSCWSVGVVTTYLVITIQFSDKK